MTGGSSGRNSGSNKVGKQEQDGEAMKRIESDAELQRLRAVGTGLIYNDFSGTGPSGSEYNILHATNCHWLHHANLNVPKIHFYSLTEAQA